VVLAGLLLLPFWLPFALHWSLGGATPRVAAAVKGRSVGLALVTRKPGWLIAVVGIGLLIAAGTAVTGALLSGDYSDPTRRLTAWAVSLAGGTLAVAILGLPVALYQLATVRRDLERVTRASEFELGLNDLMLPGVDLLERFHPQDDRDIRAAVAGWAEVIAQYIREKTANEIEEKLFRLEGQDLEPRRQLERKILYLRDNLIPKVRAGYWQLSL
jgi:hypothetical protein